MDRSSLSSSLYSSFLSSSADYLSSSSCSPSFSSLLNDFLLSVLLERPENIELFAKKWFSQLVTEEDKIRNNSSSTYSSSSPLPVSSPLSLSSSSSSSSSSSVSVFSSSLALMKEFKSQDEREFQSLLPSTAPIASLSSTTSSVLSDDSLVTVEDEQQQQRRDEVEEGTEEET